MTDDIDALLSEAEADLAGRRLTAGERDAVIDRVLHVVEQQRREIRSGTAATTFARQLTRVVALAVRAGLRA